MAENKPDPPTKADVDQAKKELQGLIDQAKKDLQTAVAEARKEIQNAADQAKGAIEALADKAKGSRSARVTSDTGPGDGQPFTIEILDSFLSALRLVRLYEDRTTRHLVVPLLVEMGLAEPDPSMDEGSGRVTPKPDAQGRVTPSPAEQLLAEFCAVPPAAVPL